MIEAKDLRIGNYALYNGGATTEILGINNQLIWHRVVGCKGVSVDNITTPFIDTIPLTEEWLFKFKEFKPYEFIKGRKFYKFGNLIVECIPKSSLVIYWSNEILCIKDYVHELQNFVHSTFGTELTIK